MRALRLWTATAVVAAGLCAGAAFADGLPRSSYPPGFTPAYMPTVTYDWTGIYLGGHLGGANTRTQWDYSGIPALPLFTDAVEHSHSGLTGGGFAGLQKQWSVFVFGAEVGYLWMDQPESSQSVFASPGNVLSSNVRELLLVTGKFGWANENMLAYFKGGYATGTVDFRTQVVGTLAPVDSSSSREHGWTAGAGLEYALWNHIIVGVEYDYVKLIVGNRSQIPAGGGAAVNQVTNAGVDMQSVTARLSFKFGG